MALRDEIFEQPAVLRRWMATRMEEVERVASAVRERGVEYVFLAARGTSDNAGVYAQYLMGSRNGLPVALAAPSLFTMYDEAPRLGNALVVAISQSGQSPDIVSVVKEGRKQGAITLAITNDAESPLAQGAEMVLDLQAGPERAVAATKTYTAELMALACLSTAMAGSREEDLEALARVPSAVESALGLDGEAERIARQAVDMAHCVVLGRGYNYATAQEWALKLKELAYVFTDVYSTADVQHGPIAILEEGCPVLAIASKGAVFADQIALLKRLRDEYGAEVVVISDSEEALEIGHAGLRVGDGLPEWLTPIVNIVAGQLFTYHLARSKGLDVEKPRTLRKVTLTQ
jgi:glucosamine--fructose-6-phosphate aminotransferase (isomerizing)